MEAQKRKLLEEEVGGLDDQNTGEELQSIGEKYEGLLEKHEGLLKKHEGLVKKYNDLVEKHDENLFENYDNCINEHVALTEKHDIRFKKNNALRDCDDHEPLTKKHKVQKHSDEVKCPVCSDAPNKAPIPICPSGHVVCSTCVKEQEECPTCRNKINKVKHDDLMEKYNVLVKNNKNLRDDHIKLTKKHKDLVQQLRDKVECPVCLVAPNKAPIPICPNGHVVCTKCVREDCPKCRVKMGQGKSTLAVTVIENLDHQCENEGCQEVIPFEGLASHGKNCNYRMVTCPNLNCNIKIPLSSLASHVVSSSCTWDKIEVHKLPRVLSFTYTRDNHQSEKALWDLCAMRFGKQIFVLKVARFIINGNGRWFFLVQMFGGVEDASGYKATIIVHRRDEGSEGSYSYKYRGDVCPIDVTSFDDAEDKGLCLLLSDGAMEKLLCETSEGNSKRSFSVSVNLVETCPSSKTN